jgi:CubicO group peptidase (beta-lactamase class C family)
MKRIGLLVLGFVVLTGFSDEKSTPSPRYERLAARLERLRQDLSIPGMAAAVVYNDQIVWMQGFGYADVDRQVPATPHTPFHVASITKTVAAVAILQLVAQGKVQLDAPASTYGAPVPAGITVRHLLSHTSNGVPPGAHFMYDGNRYGALEDVVKSASGLDFGTYVARYILRPLHLQETAYADGRGYKDEPRGIDFSKVLKQVAKPYAVGAQGQIVHGTYYSYFGTSAGLISSVFDLAKYAVALDMGALLPKAQLQAMWTAQQRPDGSALPYGLGWFVQPYEDLQVVYHFGVWGGCSSLLLKVPERKLSFILLANNERLSSLFDFLGPHGVASSPFALTFLHSFALAGGKVPPLAAFDTPEQLAAQLRKLRTTPALPWLRQELAMLAIAYQKAGHRQQGQDWFLAYHRWLGKPTLARIRKEQQVLAVISQVGDSKLLKEPFSLPKPSRVGILAMGEAYPGGKKLVDKASLHAADGKLIWQMAPELCTHAGGAPRNLQQFQWMDLPAGQYELRYQTDERHSWLSWQDVPPAEDFYGAVVFTRKAGGKDAPASMLD